ncbi:hypothetical protein BV22DRAFT_1016200, partial [Leucogyrophana mollusca]
GHAFGVGIFHQMHCIQIIRKAVIEQNSVDAHNHRCLNLMRQAVPCVSDTTLDPMNVNEGGRLMSADEIGVVHICRDWEKVYDCVRTSHMSSVWNSTRVRSSL